MNTDFDCIIRVYDKHKHLLAIFDGNTDGYTENEIRNCMVAPTVHIATNGESTLSFQMLVKSEKWNLIKDPENIYVLNGRHYTALNEDSYIYSGEDAVRVVTVTLVETWYLLSKKYNMAYNCGLYSYAKATFLNYTADGAVFQIHSNDCSIPGGAITKENAWKQVKLWQPKDKDGNQLTYTILKSKEYEPKNWNDAPSAVQFTNISVFDSYITVTAKAAGKTSFQQNFEYEGSKTFQLKNMPYPSQLQKVYVNTTITSEKEVDVEDSSVITNRYETFNKEVAFSYSSSSGRFTIKYNEEDNEEINYVIAVYDTYDLGKIKSGATCTFAYGAEVVDEHTFLILPKANNKYKLTINNVEYSDDEVKDSRGVIMPRGSGGYAMWAALKDSGWTLGICDVIATDFNTDIDYGCFNVESDMQDVLYNVQYIQELYGGILDWNSKEKILNYRAENDVDYQSYKDNFNKWKGYEFRPEKNMTKLPEVTYDNSIITRAYLLGYGNLNVKKVNSGKTYIEDFSYTTDIYEGYLEQSLIYDTNDDGGMKQLLYWGKKELSKKCRPRKTIKIEATDIRTVEGYEHEVFDVNDIVRVYYQDDDTNTLKYEDQRVISWEYNAFALWECAVELGDKTQNLSEIFKLIYNKVEQSPKPNGNGNISSSDITLIPDNSDGKWGGNLSDSIQFIAQTTTKNSDAIAGLIMQTNSLYSSVDLFASYQKQTENRFSQTYAGLKFYADEKSAEAIVSASNNTTQQIKDYNGTVLNMISDSEAALRTYADEKSAEASLSANTYTEQQIRNLEGRTDTKITNATANLVLKSEMDSAIAALSSVYTTYNTVNNMISNATADFVMQTDLDEAITYIENTYAKNSAIPTEAGIKVLAKDAFSEVTSWTMGGDAGTTISQSLGTIKISSAHKIVLDCPNITIEDIYGSGKSTTFDFNGATVKGISGSSGGTAVFG